MEAEAKVIAPDMDPGQKSTTRILGVPVANFAYDGVVEQVLKWAKRPQSRYIGVCNVHSITSAAWTPGLGEALRSSDLNTADGMPLVWMQRWMGYSSATRVYGPTLMLRVLEKAVPEGLRMAFYGGHPDRLPLLLEKLRKRFPGIQVAEIISPPFRQLTEAEDQQFTQLLNKAEADIVWVGIGCPKQELWMHQHRGKFKGVMIGVGAAFDFHAGSVRQAPPILQHIGLEWLFRLYCEPRRLLKRYVTTNPVFIFRAGIQVIKKIFAGRSYIQPGLNDSHPFNGTSG